MNATKQFWTLLKFHFGVGPYVWVLPLAFCTPLLFMSMGNPPLNMLLLTQNLFLVVLFGGVMLAPDIFTPSHANPTGSVNIEFLVTRAVDKAVLARAKTAFFFAIILAAPVVMLLVSLRHPGMRTRIFDTVAQTACLGSVPGSSRVFLNNPDLISIPSGNVILALWRAWIFVALGAAVQVLIYAVYPLRFRRWILTSLMFAVAFLPALSPFMPHDSVAWDLKLFFLYAGHPAAFWVAAIAALILGQLWSERRFAALEV